MIFLTRLNSYDLDDLYNKRQKLSYMDIYRDELDTKRKLTLRINDIQEKMELLEFEIDNIEKSILKLSEEKRDIDFDTLSAIYDEAKSYIPELQKNFEDMVNFHNTMIQNRIDFIQQQLKSKHELLERYSQQLGHLSMIFDAKWQNFCVRKIPMPMLV